MNDLSALEGASTADAGATLEVLHPATGQPMLQDDGSPVTITLLGQDSRKWRAFVRQTTNRRLQSRKAKQTAEEIEAENTEGWVALTVAWKGIVLAGEALECTPANARMIYGRFPFIREQVAEFVSDRANFLRGNG